MCIMVQYFNVYWQLFASHKFHFSNLPYFKCLCKWSIRWCKNSSACISVYTLGAAIYGPPNRRGAYYGMVLSICHRDLHGNRILVPSPPVPAYPKSIPIHSYRHSVPSPPTFVSISTHPRRLLLCYYTVEGHHVAGRSGLAVARLTAVREVLGSNRAVGSCVYCTTTVIYSLGYELCVPFLQCLGQLSLLPSVGR